MDTWQDDQIKRMQLGGNGPFREFMESYTPVEQGGYKDGLSPYDTYHCWAATQYREKLDATLAGKDWTPSLPPEPTADSASPALSSSGQALRKSRTSTRSATGGSMRSNTPSPASFRSSPRGTPDLSSDRKAANESYFASLGQANASRPVDLPPSQGGRYQGFGSTPPPSQHPSYGLSSAAAPSLSDLQENPMGALSKGWSLFSAAVVGASKAVTENVIQPGIEKVTDPNLQASVKGYMTEAQKRAAVVGSSANQWSKSQFGVDVAESVGGVVGTVKDRIVGTPRGYGALPMDHDGETSGLYHDDEDDFFKEYDSSQPYGQPVGHTRTGSTASSSGVQVSSSSTRAGKKDDWDEWKDF